MGKLKNMPSLLTPRMKIGLLLLLVLAIAALTSGRYLLKTPGDPAKAIPTDEQPVDDAAASGETQAVQSLLMQAIDQGRFADVLANAQTLVKRYPKYAPAHVLLAQALLSSGQHAASYQQMKIALSLTTSPAPTPKAQAEMQLLAGTIAEKADQPDLAQDHLRSAISLLPQEIRPRLMLATSLMNGRKYDQARDVILMALTLDQRSHKGYALLADLYHRQNQPGLAIDQIQKAIDLVPADQRAALVSYLRVKAAILRRANQPDQAMQVLLALKPKERLDLVNLEEMALCLAMQGKPLDAAALVESRLKMDPTDDLAAARAAKWYLKAGDRENAQRLMDLARSINPAHME